jgi:uncharacterized protein (TIGR00296 family)
MSVKSGDLSLDEGRLLVRTARRVIEEYVTRGRIPNPEVPERLRQPRGVFVTLTEHGELRGCIGYPFPVMPLIDALIAAAVSAATRDPRFPPVTPDELGSIEIEVSVLSEPELIRVNHPREYLEKVEIGVHGLIVQHGGYSGLLLPQVPVELGWDVEEFLCQTCMKAGLPPDSWLRKDVTVMRFTAQIFAERGPRGEVEERKPA